MLLMAGQPSPDWSAASHYEPRAETIARLRRMLTIVANEAGEGAGNASCRRLPQDSGTNPKAACMHATHARRGRLLLMVMHSVASSRGPLLEAAPG